MSGAGRGIWLLLVIDSFDGFGWRLAWIMLFLEISGWFVDELLFGWSDGLNRGLGLVGCGVVGLWSLMDLALIIGECDDVIQSSRWLCDRRSFGRVRRGDRGWGVTEVTERLMMLDVELVVNLCRSSRAFSRNCCVIWYYREVCWLTYWLLFEMVWCLVVG